MRYEYEMTRNIDLFLETENYFISDTRVRAGISLDCWGKFKISLGLEGKSDTNRAFLGYPKLTKSNHQGLYVQIDPLRAF